ncbi:preprotein translocase subunit SecG [Xanthobacter sp. KR7-65]|uniref:preprotein translocase subunit SecG n=1 Tax=Xanthobacter sp. KR7-65 TaxID=3156612 RepID=UPI0032B5A1C1
MQTVLIVIHLMVVLALIGVVLIQRSEGGGLGIGGGGGGSGGGFFSARGSANLLTRATAILAVIFFITSLALTIVATWGRAPRSILPPAQQGQGGPQVPQSGGSILDQIRPPAPGGAAPQGGAPAAPAAPATPSGPQVPQSQ